MVAHYNIEVPLALIHYESDNKMPTFNPVSLPLVCCAIMLLSLNIHQVVRPHCLGAYRCSTGQVDWQIQIVGNTSLIG